MRSSTPNVGEKAVRRGRLRRVMACAVPALLVLTLALPAAAQSAMPQVSIGFGQAKKPEDVSMTLQIVALLTVLSVAPAILMMMTSFTRIVIVLGFTRSALERVMNFRPGAEGPADAPGRARLDPGPYRGPGGVGGCGGIH